MIAHISVSDNQVIDIERSIYVVLTTKDSYNLDETINLNLN